jgi:hypothetical protein
MIRRWHSPCSAAGMTRPLSRLALALLVAAVSHACASRSGPLAPVPPSAARTLTPFKSTRDLQSAMDRVATSRREADEARRAAAAAAEAAWQERCRRMERDDFVVVCGRSPTIDGMTVSRRRIMAATRTNQHAGLEEGVVVKRHGDVLIVLRRGRLFTFAIGGGQLASVAVTDASGLRDGDLDDWAAWYDELFVSGQTVVVLGYGSDVDGMRIGLFDLDAAGGLRHRDTYHLRSQDYIAASNQSARLIGDRLVLSTSMSLIDPDGGLTNWRPAIGRRDGTGAVPPMRVVPATRVMEPVRELDHHSQAHSVISCQLAPSFRCDATVVLADWLAAYYVSPTAAYLWTTPWLGRRTERSVLYRIPLDGGAVTAIGISGAPSSQLSFLEDEQQIFNVAIDNAEGVWLLRLPLSSFSDGREDAQAGDYRPLQEGDGLGATVRFVGPYAIAIVHDLSTSEVTRRVVAVRLEDGRRFPLLVPHDTHRIDTIGDDAVILGPGDDGGRRITAIAFDPEPALSSTLDLPSVPGFEHYNEAPLYRKDDDDSGLLGLPIFAGTSGHWHERPPQMVFVSHQRHSLSLSGTIDGAVAPDQSLDHTQAFFVGDRMFALMGGELVEGRQTASGVEVVRRIELGRR